MGLISAQRFEFHKLDRISSMDPDQSHNHGKERLNVLLVVHFGEVVEVDSSLAVVAAADSSLAVVAVDSSLAAVEDVDSRLAVVAVERVAAVAQPAVVALVVEQVEKGAFELERLVEEEIAFFQQLEKK